MRKTVQILDELKINYPDLVYPETMVDKLEIYLDILQKWNHKTNLTAVDGYLNLIRKHIVDSLAIFYMKSIKQKWVTLSGNVLDMGSGAGVPGIVLSIYYNVLNVYSVDKSKIKTTFQERVKTRIGLTNYHPLNNRLERLTESAEHYLRYDFIISRAFDQLKGLLRFGKFFLKKDGYMILWKGKRWKLEWDSVPEETKREFLVVERTQYLFNSFDGGGTLLLIRKNN